MATFSNERSVLAFLFTFLFVVVVCFFGASFLFVFFFLSPLVATTNLDFIVIVIFFDGIECTTWHFLCRLFSSPDKLKKSPSIPSILYMIRDRLGTFQRLDGSVIPNGFCVCVWTGLEMSRTRYLSLVFDFITENCLDLARSKHPRPKALRTRLFWTLQANARVLHPLKKKSINNKQKQKITTLYT